jgi:NitT/TauT family transport system permease protein
MKWRAALRLVRQTAIATICIGLWEALFQAGVLNPLIFGSPSLVVAAMLKDGGVFLHAFYVTTWEIVVASVIAWIAGTASGVIIGASPLIGLASVPILSGIIAVPLVVLYPILVAWLGIGTISKVVYGAAVGFFPIALGTVLGIRSIDPRFRVLASAMGASWRQTLVHVMVPLAIPAIVSGLRVGTSLTIVGVIQSEMLSATDGLGFWISYNRTLFNVGQVYFGILLTLILAGIANASLSRIERRYSRWESRGRETTAGVEMVP